MGKSSKAPAAPDPKATADAQAQANRLDVYGPEGIQQQFGFSQNGMFTPGKAPDGIPAAVKVHETPFDAWLRQTGQGITHGLATTASNTAANLGPGAAAPTAGQFGATPLPTAPSDEGLPERATADAATRDRVEKALFERSASLLRPEIERQDRSIQNRLQSNGIPLGSEAFNDTYGAFTRETGDMWSRLADQSVIGGGQEMERDYGLKADARARAHGEQDRNFNYGTTTRNMAIGDAARFYDFQNNQRGRDLSELSAILGGAYSPAATVANPSVAPVDVMGPINTQYQGQLAGWQAGNQARSGMWGNLTALGGAAILSSSRTLKTDMGEIDGEIALDMVARLPIHAWRYRDGTPYRDEQVHIGPFAEDFHEITDASTDDAIFATDPAGLALAAVKALMARVTALQAKVDELQAA